MEFDFDDILKEFGVDSENEKIPEKQNAPLQEDVALTEPEEEPADDFAEADDLYEQSGPDPGYDYEEVPAGTDNPGSQTATSNGRPASSSPQAKWRMPMPMSIFWISHPSPLTYPLLCFS